MSAVARLVCGNIGEGEKAPAAEGGRYRDRLWAWLLCQKRQLGCRTPN
jgi:hypothetical protein